jgi:hypothetical protein
LAITCSLAGATGSAAALLGQPKTGVLAPARAACDARSVQTATTKFLAALNSGDQRRLDRLIAPTQEFRRYEVYGPVGARLGNDARRRATLIGYLSERRRHSEQLKLTWFSFARSAPGTASFRFDVVRSGDDLVLPTLYRGTGAISCPGRRQLVAWTMAPNTEPSLPAPQTYADTCRLVGTWCEFVPSPGSIPDSLRRPLAFPTVVPGSECPVTTTGSDVSNGLFGGFAIGEGPVRPMLSGGRLTTHLVHVFRPQGSRGWYAAKTLWFSWPQYRGPVLIRGRQLDGPHKVVFGGGPRLIDPQLGHGEPLNSRDGWRTWPGGTWLRTPGCYAWQIDGTDFSNVIVFDAVFDSGCFGCP